LPGAKIIIDTAHLYGQQFLTNREVPNIEKEGLRKRQRAEIISKLIKLAHKIVVSNSKEKQHIENMFDKKHDVHVVPRVYKILSWAPPFKMRKNICLLGCHDFNHRAYTPYNFLDDIFSTTSLLHPDMNCHLITNDLRALNNPPKSTNFKTIAVRKHLVALLSNYKLCVFPVGYTSPSIDAFGISAATGVPIVASEIAAEGYPVSDGSECFIAKSPLEFVEKCNQCLSDPIAWNNFRIKSQIMIAENFSPKVISLRLQKIFIN
jgi:hypothetical protein